MKFPVIAVVALFASSLMAQSNAVQANGPIFSFHSKGTFANVFSFQNNSDIFLNVSRNGEAGQQATTLLNYTSFTFTSTGFTDTFAFGAIPNDSLRGGNDKHVSLNVDTSQVSSFQATTCTFDFTSFTFTCQPGPFGLVQLDWEQDGNSTTQVVSDERDKFFQFTIHHQRNADSATATVTGSVVGLPVSGGFANIGVNHDSTMEFFKN